MPTRDTTSDVSEQSQRLLRLVKAKVRQRVFLGPGITKLSAGEALDRLKSMNPQDRASLLTGPQRDTVMLELEQLLKEVNSGRH